MPVTSRSAALAPALLLSVAVALPASAAGPAVADQPAPTHPYVVTARPGTDAKELALTAGVTPRVVLSAVLTGFVADLDDRQAAVLRARPGVVAVEPEKAVRIDGTQSIAAGTGLDGLDRIDQGRLPLSGSYTTSSRGAGATVYVVDTGIDRKHPDFTGRAAVAFDALGGKGQDCNGHGTHVAGTIGGSTYGVAKQVSIRAVRALDCAGNGTTTGVLAALDWLRLNAVRPAVVNLSFSSDYSQALNDAVEALSTAGLVTVAAAGNGDRPACSASPASAPSAITVAAAGPSDTRDPSSNYGSCVDVYAPGVDVTSAAPGGGSATKSGTSMAAPHVAGVAALYQSSHDESSPQGVHSWIQNAAVRNLIRRNPQGTPNLLVNTGGL